MEGRKREDRFTATETFERLLAEVKKVVNEFGGGQKWTTPDFVDTFQA